VGAAPTADRPQRPRSVAKTPDDPAGPFERAQRETETIRWTALRRRFRNGALGTAGAHGFRSAETEREFSIDIKSYGDDRFGRRSDGERVAGAHDVAARLMLAAAIDGCEGLAGELRSARRSSRSTSPIRSNWKRSSRAGRT
jgi:hypothetical protein